MKYNKPLESVRCLAVGRELYHKNGDKWEVISYEHGIVKIGRLRDLKIGVMNEHNMKYMRLHSPDSFAFDFFDCNTNNESRRYSVLALAVSDCNTFFIDDREGNGKYFMVTHKRTGLMVTSMDTLQQAVDLVSDLLALDFNWDRGEWGNMLFGDDDKGIIESVKSTLSKHFHKQLGERE